MRSGFVELQDPSPTLYPFEIMVVVGLDGSLLSFVTETMAQLKPVLPRPIIGGGLNFFFPFTGIGKVLGSLSEKSTDSMPVSAAKNALLVSRALVPNLTSLNAILVMPNAIDKTILENVTAKSKTNPLLFCKLIFISFSLSIIFAQISRTKPESVLPELL